MNENNTKENSNPDCGGGARPKICQSQESGSRTIVIEKQEPSEDQSTTTLKLSLTKKQSGKKVNWTEETVDNEHMGKKKSKCCCIYVKPKVFGEESSGDESDDCSNCFGHRASDPGKPKPHH